MTVKVDLPFKVTLSLAERRWRGPDEVSLKRLRDAVAGRDSGFSRSHAMALLQISDFPNKHRDFQAVLENESEPSEIRYLATVSLGRMNTQAAVDILLRNSEARDERVLAGVMKALGRIGGESSLSAVLRARDYAKGLAASYAEFAALLISHRIGLKGDESTVAEHKSYMELRGSAASSPLQLSRADSSDGEFCLRALGDQPFGIELTEHSMYQLRCERRLMMILFNREFIGRDAVRRLSERKAILGIVANRMEVTGSYSPSLLWLTSPAHNPGTVNLMLYRSTGQQIFGGTGTAHGERLEFNIRALPRPGAFGVQIDGHFENGKLEFKTAQAAMFIQQPKRQPREFAAEKITAS